MIPAFPLLSKVVSPASCPLIRENNGEGELGRGRDGEEMVVILVIFRRVSAKIFGVTSFLLQEIRGSLFGKTYMYFLLQYFYSEMFISTRPVEEDQGWSKSGDQDLSWSYGYHLNPERFQNFPWSNTLCIQRVFGNFFSQFDNFLCCFHQSSLVVAAAAYNSTSSLPSGFRPRKTLSS